MGSQQQFCLRWNNHQLNMLGVFDQLLQSEALVDVTIACEGLSLKAHKVVLSACSPFFQSLFLDNPCKHPIVILKDIKYSDLKALIDFMYRGEVNVSQEQLSALLQTAETLKVKGLAEVTGGMSDTMSENIGRQSAMLTQQTSQDEPSPSQGAVQSFSGADESMNSPPSKRKKIRSRRRSGGSSNHSDKEDDDIHIPSEVVEAKVEIMDDDEPVHESASSLDSEIKTTFTQPSNTQPVPLDTHSTTETVLALNRSFASAGGMESLSCSSTSDPASASALSRTTQMPPPLIPSQANMLAGPSLPSTSGNQTSGQGRDGRSPPDARPLKEQLEENLKRAAVQVLKHSLSIRAASRHFGIPYKALHRYVSRIEQGLESFPTGMSATPRSSPVVSEAAM